MYSRLSRDFPYTTDASFITSFRDTKYDVIFPMLEVKVSSFFSPASSAGEIF